MRSFEWAPNTEVVLAGANGSEEVVFVRREDPDHSVGEERLLVLGMSTQGRLIVVAFVERPPRTRLISARLATRRERHDYEEEQS